jgi:hypothetical protein
MKQKILYTIFLFILPVLQKEIGINALAGIKFDIQFLIISIVILSTVLIVAIIYFVLAVIKWIKSGFKLNKLLPCIVSLIAVFCLNYSIRALMSNRIKSIKNRFQGMANSFVKVNTEIV